MAEDPVLVSGALGFVAGHVIERLLARGGPVIAIVRPGRDAARLEARGIAVRRADLSRPVGSDVFAGARTFIHLAGMAQATHWIDAFEASGVERAVFISSAGVYTKLKSSGAEAKRVAEARLRRSPLVWTILRPSMIYGTGLDRNMSRLLRWLKRWPFVPVPGGGRTMQQPVHVEDLCDAMFAALERPVAARKEYDLGGPVELPLTEVIRAAAAALGKRVLIVPIPLEPAVRTVRLMRRIGLPAPVREEQVLRLAESKAVDITDACRDLEFRPRSFDDGIRAEAALL